MAYGLWKSGAEVVAPHINLSQGLGSGPVRDGSGPSARSSPRPMGRLRLGKGMAIQQGHLCAEKVAYRSFFNYWLIEL